MARTTDPVCKLCRREGIKLYLKGSRCESPKCAIERRNTPPGMHVRRGKQTEYGERRSSSHTDLAQIPVV